jgi:glyoxylase-like metal-dependent hydrolase (beta-lactamase superfamily II)
VTSIRDAGDAGEAAAELRVAGIHTVAVPTPFQIPALNAYLVDDDPLTLVDTGPNWATAFDALESGLRDLGVRLTDIGLILLTHQHMDHVGLAGLLERRSRAAVGALDVLVGYLADYQAGAAADDAVREQTMTRNGVDPALA